MHSWILTLDCAKDHVAIASFKNQIYVAGGSNSKCSKSLDTLHIFDMETNLWEAGPSMNQERWYHGLLRLDDTLYAVGGCGQLNTLEALRLSTEQGQKVSFTLGHQFFIIQRRYVAFSFPQQEKLFSHWESKPTSLLLLGRKLPRIFGFVYFQEDIQTKNVLSIFLFGRTSRTWTRNNLVE